MKTLVIYHRADFDGIFCYQIAKKFLGTEDVEYVGWDYGDKAVPMPQEGLVYILDLSPDCLDASAVEGTIWNRIIWIDHHKSAIDRFQPPRFPDIKGYRIDEVAACRLAWQWFAYERLQAPVNLPAKADYVNRELDEPYAVRLAGEYDIWDKRDPNAELFQHGLRSQEISENLWELLLVNRQVAEFQEDVGTVAVHALLDAGNAIQYSETKENASIIKAAGFTLQFEGLNFLACNAARYNSLLFTAGLTPEHDVCFGFAWREGHWHVSLYHAPGKEHHDLSQIAVKYGGGGHRGACGFRVKSLPFLTRDLIGS